MSAEPHAGHKIGWRDPKVGNVQHSYLIFSRESFNSNTGLVYAMAISSKVRESNSRKNC